MLRQHAILTSTIVVIAAATGAPASDATPTRNPSQSLVLDAAFTHVRAAGPDVNHVGHRQIVSGVLRSARGRRIGTFSFTCVWRSVRRDVALERCVGSARTRDGRLDAAGPARSNESTQTWSITGGTTVFHGARGSVSVRDLNDRESLLTVSVTTRRHALVHAGSVSRPPINRAFVATANARCADASRRLAQLPPFPLDSFDPLHPQPAQLAEVGAFFTGPGDPRPALRTLRTALHTLQQPPSDRRAWTSVLHTRDRELSVIDEQDRAALARDVQGFVKSVHASSAAFRSVALAAAVFGVSACVL